MITDNLLHTLLLAYYLCILRTNTRQHESRCRFVSSTFSPVRVLFTAFRLPRAHIRDLQRDNVFLVSTGDRTLKRIEDGFLPLQFEFRRETDLGPMMLGFTVRLGWCAAYASSGAHWADVQPSNIAASHEVGMIHDCSLDHIRQWPSGRTKVFSISGHSHISGLEIRLEFSPCPLNLGETLVLNMSTREVAQPRQ